MIEFLNHLGADALPCARQIVWQTALLVAVLSLLDLLVARRLRSTLRCALWLLVVVKLLLPPSLQFPTGAGFWLGRWLAEPIAPRTSAGPSVLVETLDPTLSPEDAGPAISVPPSAATLNLRGGLLLAWITGSQLLGLGLVIRNHPVRRLEREAEEAPEQLQAQVQVAAGELGLAVH
jgi:beta-lactamase regulating signal transducer with metallopeptidase domain